MLFRSCLRDVSERATEALLHAVEKRVLERFAADAPVEAVLEALLDVAAAQPGHWRFAVQSLEPAIGRLVHGAAPRLPREFVVAMDGVPAEEPGYGSCAAALQDDGEVWIEHVASDLRWTHRAEAEIGRAHV